MEARASATRCHWPPERSTPPGRAGSHHVARPAGRCARGLQAAAARGGLHRRPVPAGAEIAQGDVLAQRQAVAPQVLEHGRGAGAETRRRDVAQRDAVDEHPPGVGLQQSQDQPGQGRLAGAVGSLDTMATLRFT